MGRRKRTHNRYGNRRTVHKPWLPDDIVLHIFRSKKRCDTCGEPIERPGLAQATKDHLICTECTGVSTWTFLPAGHVGLTRRASLLAKNRCVVVGRAGRGFVREGILVPDEALRTACEQLAIEYNFRPPDFLGGTSEPEYRPKIVKADEVVEITPKPKPDPLKRSITRQKIAPRRSTGVVYSPPKRKPKIYKPAPYVAGDAPKEKPPVSDAEPHPEAAPPPWKQRKKTAPETFAPSSNIKPDQSASREGHDVLSARLGLRFPDIAAKKIRKVAGWALETLETTTDRTPGEILSLYLRR